MRFVYCPGYSDYYSSAKGGSDNGRGIEPVPFDGRVLGDWLEKAAARAGEEPRPGGHDERSALALPLQPQHPAPSRSLPASCIRTYAARLRRQELLTNGASLIAQMLQDRRRPWGRDLDGHAARRPGRRGRSRRRRAGAPIRGSRVIHARQGVLLAAGGFAHNSEMREQYGGDQPNQAKWSISNPGDTGDAMRSAMALGAKTDLMDEAWWLPSPRTGQLRAVDPRSGAAASPHDLRRCRRAAVRQRVELVHGSRQGDVRPRQDEPGGPVLADLRRPLPEALRPSALLPGRFPRKLLKSGMLKQAWTLEELAAMCGIDPAGLAETVERFNEHAATGVDPEYGRGESAYNRALGDPNHKVHPCLGPIDEAPFYAVEVVPGDIGTCGGMVTNEHAQVVDQDDRPIEGLYATGNGTATVMGVTTWGPARASPTPWSSATSRLATRLGERPPRGHDGLTPAPRHPGGR